MLGRQKNWREASGFLCGHSVIFVEGKFLQDNSFGVLSHVELNVGLEVARNGSIYCGDA